MWFAGFSTTFSLFLEEKVRPFRPSLSSSSRTFSLANHVFVSISQRRRSELALYVLPRGLSAAHSMLRKRALVPRHVPLGEGILAGLAMAVLADRTRWGPEDLGGLVRRGESRSLSLLENRRTAFQELTSPLPFFVSV